MRIKFSNIRINKDIIERYRSLGGFTLVETLVAVTIIVLTIIGPLSIASNGLKTSLLSKDQLIAVALAQDALENLRNARDANILSGADWLNVIGSNCKVTGGPNGRQGCIVDSTLDFTTNPNTIEYVDQVTSGHNNRPINYDSSSGLYGYTSTWAQTKFFRIATLNEFLTGQEARVTVTVSWTDRAFGSQSVSMTENLLNW